MRIIGQTKRITKYPGERPMVISQLNVDTSN